MKDNRRDFIKKSASLAAAFSIGGIGSAISSPRDLDLERKSHLNTSDLVKDAGMKLCLSMDIDSPRVLVAQQMAVGACTGGNSKAIGDLKPWEPKAIKAIKEAWDKKGIKWDVVEGPPSLALGAKTKLGLDGRDEEIENFITYMKNLKEYGGGVDTISYGWQVLNWPRTDYYVPARGGASVTAFDYSKMDQSLTKYGKVSVETMWKSLEYFLKAVIPEAEKHGIKLGMHPTDPPVPELKGIARPLTTVDAFKRMIDIYPSYSNGVTVDQSVFSVMGANVPALIEYLGKRNLIQYVHFRNMIGNRYKNHETFIDEGQVDTYRTMKALYDNGFRGPIRPDHVPTMGGDTTGRPAYTTLGTLYAVGYIRGLMNAVSRTRE